MRLRWLAIAGALGAALCLVALSVVSAAHAEFSDRYLVSGSTNERSSCFSIRLDGDARVFYKHNMNCGTAKRYANRVHRSRGAFEPPKFSCESGSNFDEGGACQHVSKNKNFGWHPAD